jgi:CHAT domain-containing protein/tetratricopeptide (TPR) repeat protein
MISSLAETTRTRLCRRLRLRRRATWMATSIVVFLSATTILPVAVAQTPAKPQPEPSQLFAGKTEAELRAEFKRLSDEYDALAAARKLPELEVVARRLLLLSKQLFGPDHLTTLDVMMWLANTLETKALQEEGAAAFARRQVDPPMQVAHQAAREEAIALLQRRFDVLLLARKGLGDEDVKVAQARLVNTLRAAGRKSEADALAAMGGPNANPLVAKDDPGDITKLSAEAKTHFNAGQFAEAAAKASRSVEIAERLGGKDHPLVSSGLVPLAEAERALGNIAAAKAANERVLPLLENQFGRHHGTVGVVASNLAGILEALGDFAAAEREFHRAKGILDTPGSLSPQLATVLSNLAGLYGTLGRHEEAERLYRRVLAIREASVPPTDPSIASVLGNLAWLLQKQGPKRSAEGLDLSLRARQIEERRHAGDPSHPDVALAAANHAVLLEQAGRLDEAEALARRALAAREQRLPKQHPDIAISRSNLAAILERRSRYPEAHKLLHLALEQAAVTLGEGHPDTGLIKSNIARVYIREQKWGEALTYLQQGADAAVDRSQKFALSALDRPVAGKAMSEVEQFRFWMHVLTKVARRVGDRDPQTLSKAFAAAQWGQISAAATSLAEMAVRGASGDPELAQLVRERQDIAAEWQQRDRVRAAAFALPVDQRDRRAEASIAARLGAIDRRIGEIDLRLKANFSDYAARVAPEPLTVEQVQSNLGPDEAVVLALETSELKPIPEETFVWVVTKTDVRWARSDLGTQALSREVAALRCGLDSSSWEGAGEANCQKLLNTTAKLVDFKGAKDVPPKPLPFDTNRAHNLYKALFGEVEDLIKGKHLLLVPSGALTTLPFQVLLTRQPAPNADYRDHAWLINDHALTVLPAVSSLKALREPPAKTSKAKRPFIGFGDPVLRGWIPDFESCADVRTQGEFVGRPSAAADKKAASTEAPATNFAGQPTATPAQKAGSTAAPAADARKKTSMDLPTIELVRNQLPVPETATLLCKVAEHLGAADEEVYLGSKATEATVRDLSANGELQKYRIVHFATHGLLAGGLKGRLSEPALVLTPPPKNTIDPRMLEKDDGLLTASEIAGLKLDADWVILSACNTASGEKVGAEALSGLARAFFFAGTRALLVSHWPAEEVAAERLASRVFKHAGVGRAEAFRRAMGEVLSGDEPHVSHPSYWAPFVVVGEGGR